MSAFLEAKKDAGKIRKLELRIENLDKKHNTDVARICGEIQKIRDIYDGIDGGAAILRVALDHVREVTAYKAGQA
jgi:hypothetical protein